MSEDPIRKYLDAKKELDEDLKKMEKLQSLIASVASALNEPYSFMVSNVDVGFPAEVALIRGIPSLNANDWPSARDIAVALASLHQKRRNVINLWATIPKADQRNLIPPESM